MGSPAFKIVIIMPLTAYLSAFCLPLSIPVSARTAAPKAIKAIDTIEDIEIGMSADHVIAALARLRACRFVKDPTGEWEASQDKKMAHSRSNTGASRAQRCKFTREKTTAELTLERLCTGFCTTMENCYLRQTVIGRRRQRTFTSLPEKLKRESRVHLSG